MGPGGGHFRRPAAHRGDDRDDRDGVPTAAERAATVTERAPVVAAIAAARLRPSGDDGG